MEPFHQSSGRARAPCGSSTRPRGRLATPTRPPCPGTRSDSVVRQVRRVRPGPESPCSGGAASSWPPLLPAASSWSPGAAGAAGGVGFGNNAGGGGGGQGGYVRALVPVMPASVYSVTVGAGGAGGTEASPDAVNGKAGETSVFASSDGKPLVTATGGSGGGTAAGLGVCKNPTGGAGGSGTVNSSLQVMGTTLQAGAPGGVGEPWPFCIPNPGSGAGGAGGGPVGFAGAGGAGGEAAQPSAPGLMGVPGMIAITPLD
ncbi:glycine-rich domain-containing protein [Amycolatopsis sp.]|uniref:glycine-rich domain-containing protein n=1 Tax=Amycolatopsis sp. TaxID=37632 RepID=UPI0034593755